MALLGLDTATRRVVFVSYLALWSALRLYVYGSQHGADSARPAAGGAAPYSPAALLVLTTLFKLGMSFASYACTERGGGSGGGGGGGDASSAAQAQRTAQHVQLFARYFLPAASYVVYDNMMFFCLERLDPVTYVILMQFRLPVTGVTWQAAFGKRLSIVQWCGLVLVMSACILQRSTAGSAASRGSAVEAHTFFLGLVGVGVQIGCGVFSSVYNEVMLKRGDISLHLQNIYMYTHSLFCNLAWIVASGDAAALAPREMMRLFRFDTLPIAVLLASIGIATSLFLKHLDSVRKSVASAIELFGDALLSYYFFAIAIKLSTFGAMLLCAAGIVLFSRESAPPKQQAKPEELV